MCSQIFDKTSVALSSGNFWRQSALPQSSRQIQKFGEEEKNFLEGCLENRVCSRGRNSASGSFREFLISSDVKYGAHGALRFHFLGFQNTLSLTSRRIKVN